jgi:hypothetical protein
MNHVNPFTRRESSFRNIGRVQWFAIFIVLFFLQEGVSSCGGPTVTVENNTKFPVRVVVSSGGSSQVLSPSPGESSSADASEGPYRAYAVPDADWINYAKTKRKVLDDMLANSDQLTGPQLLSVVQQLKDIAQRMAQYDQAGASGTGCTGTVSSDHDGLVQVSTGADGGLVAACK